MRLPDWLDSTNSYLETCRAKQFVWGEHDCCLFAAEVAKRITGIDYAQDFRGHYSTEKGALRAIRKYGSGNLPDTVNKYLGEPVPPLLLRRGDAALMEVDGLIGYAIGVCWVGGLVYVGQHGLVSMPLSYAVSGWRVG